MVNKDILAGLRSAIVRGYSLDEAMISFFNAGYKKEEIEESARALQTETSSLGGLPPQPIWSGQKPGTEASGSKIKQGSAISQPIPVQTQAAEASAAGINLAGQTVEEKPVISKPSKKFASRASKYSTQANPRIRTITIILLVLLVILLGILGLMYAFKTQIISFFNNIFSNA